MVYLIRKFLLISLILVGLFSCKEKIFTGDVNCDECFVDKPDSLYFTLNVTLNDKFTDVPVLIYKGNSIENGEFIDTFFCYIENGVRYDQAYLKTNENYSAKAIYIDNERTVYVVDRIKNKNKLVTSTCDQDCWVNENYELRLKLAY
jgi:hypothetical protein